MDKQITDYDVLAAMEKFGGSFASHLATAGMHANAQNLARIKVAFAGLWAIYRNLAEQTVAKDAQAEESEGAQA